jgi:hypothetical protein
VGVNDEIDFVVERTTETGPSPHGWHAVGGSSDSPADLLAGLALLLSRRDRYARAVMLHDHLRHRHGAGPRRACRRAGRPVLDSVVRLDAARVRRWTLAAAIGWAVLTCRLSGGSRRAEAVVGALAASLALPLLAAAAGAVIAVVAVDVVVWALFAAGGAVRSTMVRAWQKMVPSSGRGRL